MQHYQFWAIGVPKPQPRARATVRGRHARMYNPDTADAWKVAVRDAAANAGLAGMRLGGPICLRLDFKFLRPAAHLRALGLRPSAPQYHTQRPDVDNLAKAVMDALTEIGIWQDDDQVFDLRVTKAWVMAAPGCSIEVWA